MLANMLPVQTTRAYIWQNNGANINLGRMNVAMIIYRYLSFVASADVMLS